MSWHTGRLAAFAVQTRGRSVESARIVAACVMRVDATGHDEPRTATWQFDEKPRRGAEHPVDALPQLVAMLMRALHAGLPIAAFDAMHALTVLDRECRRWGIPTLDELVDGIGPVLCGQVLDGHAGRRPFGPSSLGECCERYGIRLEPGHDVAAAAWAAAGVVVRIAQGHREIARLELPELHARQVEWHRAQALVHAAACRREAMRSRAGDEQIDLHERAQQLEAGAGAWPVLPVTEQQGVLS
ncbi:hypothetical protein [Actinomadura sp. 21ATH]|uniref:hypothetical protein n=1 Tax=Actinomadura sp. 21ATH TaxID=1735444 RepID=UPI0035C1572D